MIAALLWILMQSAPATSQPPLPDPYAVPKAERMEWYRSVVDREKGLNGYDDYVRATKAYVRTYDFKHEEAIGKETAAWLDLNERIIPMRLDWPAEHETGIKAWLRLNADTLRATRKAAGAARCVPTGELRPPYDLATEPGAVSFSTFRTLAYLQMADAAGKARDGRWAEAYRDWTLAHRIAGHAAWSSSALGSSVRTMIERTAFDQFASLAAVTPPRDVAGLRSALTDAWALGTASGNAVIFVEQLFMADLIERDYAWARDEKAFPEHREMLDASFGLAETLKSTTIDLKVKPPPFKDVDDYKKALLASSPDAAFRVSKQLFDCEVTWCALPLPAAMRKIEGMRSEYWTLADGDPFTRFWAGESSLVPPGRMQIIASSRVLYRRALMTLIALLEWKAKHREWPESLDVLKLGDNAVDPFSEKPFIYRRSDDKKTFVLYSVGVNLTDDGGVEPSKETVIEDADGDIVLWPRKAAEYATPDQTP